jgi:hypothetical protein
MENFFGQAASIRDELAIFAPQFGQLNSIDVVICYRHQGSPTTYMQIEPTPLVATVDERYAQTYGSKAGIQIELNDLQITNISAAYTRDQVLGSFYLIGATLQGGQPVGNYFEAERVPGSALTNKSMTYQLLVRHRKPEQSLRR